MLTATEVGSAVFQIGVLLGPDGLLPLVVDGDILLPGHLHLKAEEDAELPDLFGDGQIDLLFHDAVALGPAVHPAVAGVQDDHRPGGGGQFHHPVLQRPVQRPQGKDHRRQRRRSARRQCQYLLPPLLHTISPPWCQSYDGDKDVYAKKEGPPARTAPEKSSYSRMIRR